MMKLTHHSPNDFDLARALTDASDELRAMRLSATTKSTRPPASHQERRLARMPMPSRTLGGI